MNGRLLLCFSFGHTERKKEKKKIKIYARIRFVGEAILTPVKSKRKIQAFETRSLVKDAKALSRLGGSCDKKFSPRKRDRTFSSAKPLASNRPDRAHTIENSISSHYQKKKKKIQQVYLFFYILSSTKMPSALLQLK